MPTKGSSVFRKVLTFLFIVIFFFVGEYSGRYIAVHRYLSSVSDTAPVQNGYVLRPKASKQGYEEWVIDSDSTGKVDEYFASLDLNRKAETSYRLKLDEKSGDIRLVESRVNWSWSIIEDQNEDGNFDYGEFGIADTEMPTASYAYYDYDLNGLVDAYASSGPDGEIFKVRMGLKWRTARFNDAGRIFLVDNGKQGSEIKFASGNWHIV